MARFDSLIYLSTISLIFVNCVTGLALTVSSAVSIDSSVCTSADAIASCKQIYTTSLNAGDTTSADASFDTWLELFAVQVTTAKNQSIADMQSLCQVQNQLKNCIVTVKLVCSSSSSSATIESSSNQFMNENKLIMTGKRFCRGSELDPTKQSQMEGNNLGTCVQSGQGKEIYDRVTIKKLLFGTKNDKIPKSVKASFAAKMDVDGNRGSASGSASTNAETQNEASMKALCGKIRSDVNEIRRMMRKSPGDCNDSAKSLLVEKLIEQSSGTISNMCPISDLITGTSSANPRDRKRATMVFFGSGHILSFNSSSNTTFNTCNDKEDTSIDLLNHDSIKVSGIMDTSGSVMYLKSLKVEMYKKDGSTIDSLTLDESTDDVQQQFDTTTAAQISSDGVQMKGTIRLQATSGNKKLYLRDSNSGSFVSVFKYITRDQKVVYSVVVRAPESMVNEMSGILLSGCVSNVDISTSTSGRRRKRSASSDTAGTYDGDKFNDPGAKAMSENVMMDMRLAVQEDDGMINSGQNPSLTGFFLIMNIMLGILFRSIFN